MKKLLPLIVLFALAGAGYYLYTRPPVALVLTGIVTTNDVVVSPQVSGQIGQLMVKEGDSVKADQLIAVITPDELRADRAYASQSADAIGSQVKEGEAALRFQQMQTAEQIRQAESTLSAAELQVMAAAADVEANQSLPNDVPTPGTPCAFTTVTPGCCALRSSRERLSGVSGRYS